MRKPLTATQKARRSVQAKIRRLEKKGEYVPPEVKEMVKQARYQTLESLRRDRFSKLGKTLAEAKKDNVWSKQRQIDDEYFRQRKLPESVNLVYSNVYDAIEAYPTPGANALREGLASEIAKYGRDKVAYAMENADEDLIKMATDIAQYVDSSDVIHKAIQDFFDIIKGSLPDNSETEALGEIMDRMTDMGYES